MTRLSFVKLLEIGPKFAPFCPYSGVSVELWSLGIRNRSSQQDLLRLLNTTSDLPAPVKQTLVQEGSSVFE